MEIQHQEQIPSDNPVATTPFPLSFKYSKAVVGCGVSHSMQVINLILRRRLRGPICSDDPSSKTRTVVHSVIGSGTGSGFRYIEISSNFAGISRYPNNRPMFARHHANA